MPRSKRKFITIEGQPTVELDFDAIHPTMLYAELGSPMSNEPYAIPGTGKKDRKLIKITLLKMINAKEGQTIKQPFKKVVVRDWAGRVRKKKLRIPLPLPDGMTWEEVQEAIARHNEPTRCFFRSGEGVRPQRIDSDIAETVMLRMMGRDILVLPIHDSFIVCWEYQDILREEMLKAFRERVGTDISVTAKPSLVDGIAPLTREAVDAYMSTTAASPGYEGYRERRDKFQDHRRLS